VEMCLYFIAVTFVQFPFLLLYVIVFSDSEFTDLLLDIDLDILRSVSADFILFFYGT
jgi:hypothetical protein